MDMSNWRHTQGGSGDVGDSSMESSDWRAHLQADSRERMVNRIMDAMKSHIQVSGNEGLQELERRAVSFEEKVYIAATSQSDYMRKICFKILTIETTSQNHMLDANNVNFSYSDSTNGEDWQEEVYEKIKAMKHLYLPDLHYMHQKILHKLQQHDSRPQQLNNEKIEKMKVFKNMLERFMAFLQIPKHNILPSYKDKLSTYEDQIVHVITSNLRKSAATQQPPPQLLPPPYMHHMQHNITSSIQPTFNGMASIDLTAQMGYENGGDWQEEVYQKIKAMKDLYLLDLNDMHHKILGKIQQQDSLPQQPNNEQLEKLKVFKNMLERFMVFLQIPKHNILAHYKDKLSTYEKQIVHVITSNRRKPAPTQQQQQPPQQPQQQLPPPHMQSQQTQINLTHENSMTSQMQLVNPVNLQGSSMGNLQQNGNSMSSQQTMMNSMQPTSSLDQGQSGSGTQVNMNPMVSLQPNQAMLHIKQQEQLLQNQQLEQFENRQMQQTFLHKQQLMQQQQQQFRQQGNQVNQMGQLHESNDMKLRQQQQQQMGVKPGTFQQVAGYHQQMQTQQRLLGQQNKPQQHLIGQHNNLSGMQQQHMGGQSSQSGGQQQLLGSQSGNSGMQHMMQCKIPVQQGNQQSSLPNQVQQSQPQLQQHVMPHMQGQSGQLQQQVGMQQQTNMMQGNMQQRLPNAGGFQQQNVIDQQKQLFQQQRPMQEASSTSLDSTAQTDNVNGGDWQEEVYQKIKAMKDLYLLDLNDMHQKILGKLKQHDSLPQQQNSEQIEKLKVFKDMLERFMAFLQIPKNNILPSYKDKLSTYEKQIVHIITSNRRKPATTHQQPPPPQQPLPPPHMQSQKTHSQLT